VKENRLKHLYVEELKDLYSAENQLIKALPKMAKASTSDELRTGFEKHLEQTKEHAARLERIFKALGENPKGKHCKGMEGLIEEGSEMLSEGGRLGNHAFGRQSEAGRWGRRRGRRAARV